MEDGLIDGRHKIDAAISILWDGDEVRIRVVDRSSWTSIIEIKLTPEEFCKAALGRLVDMDCQTTVTDLRRVGLIMEHRSWEFKMPNQGDFRWDKDAAKEYAKNHCPEGWVADTYFNSQGSFFTRDNESWACVTIRRWVRPESKEST